MNQNRMKTQSDPNRASERDQAEGSREAMRGSGSSSSEPRSRSSERGMGSSKERGMGSSSGGSGGSRSSSDSGGISNRERSREECEQEQLPERGSER